MKELIINSLLKNAGFRIPGNLRMILHSPYFFCAKFHFLDSILAACGVIVIRDRIFSLHKMLIFPTVPILPLFCYDHILVRK